MRTSNFDTDEADILLGDPNFSAVRYVDRLLPNESSLTDLSKITKNLQVRQDKLNDTIKDCLHSYSVLGDASEAVVVTTKRSIIKLSNGINDMHLKAIETGTIVKNICDDIKVLDNAKRNLTISVSALKKVKMVVISIEELEKNINELDYEKCAKNILALNSLMNYFKNYLETVQLKYYAKKFITLKDILKTRAINDFETIYMGTADESKISLCNLIEAYDDGFKDKIIDEFCENFMKPYTDAYKDSPLYDINNRYQWFKQRMDFFNKNFAKAFPEKWKMRYFLTIEFCKDTTSDLSLILQEQTPSVSDYLNAFSYTVKFEKKMSEEFAVKEVVPIDPNEPIPFFPSTAEGIKQKYEWIKRRDEGLGIEKIQYAKEFIGLIAGAFAPYMNLYFDSEKKKYSSLIADASKNPMKDIDPETKTLQSSALLVNKMRKTIEKTAGFGVSQSLLDLFLLLKELLIQYSMSLTKILPKPKKDEQIKLICVITNTSSLLLEVVDSLSTNIASLVSNETKHAIIVEDAKESIGAELRIQLLNSVDFITKNIETYLVQIANNTWRDEETDEKLPLKLMEYFDTQFVIYQEWLSNDNFNRLRISLIQRVVSILHDNVFKTKEFNSSPQVIQTIKDLKSTLIKYTFADSVLAKSRIDYEFSPLEAELTVLFCSSEAITQTYIAITKKKSKDHFLSILKLKGFTGTLLQKYSDEYDNEINE